MLNENKIGDILNKVFGLKSFRTIQKDIIKSILSGKNTLGIMPTGGGKSLTYQVAGLYSPGTTLVVSPLISLMQDQVNFLKSKKVNAAFYNGSLTSEEKIEVMNQIKEGSLKFLFVAPERFFIHEAFDGIDDFITIIQKYITINLIVIDEAHCVSSWGHDFREDYLRLSELATKLQTIPILSLTATADPITKEEIENSFNIKEENVFTMPIQRENIIYNVDKKYGNGYDQVLKIIKKHPNENGIVYCFTKDDVDKLTKLLKANLIKAESYHADLTTIKKTKVLKDYLDNKINVVVATIAFGMGIDKSNINYVIHKELSQTLENYYQETGRVGRDGSKSVVYLLNSARDLIKMNWIINSSSRKWVQKIKLNWMKRYIETSVCRVQSLNWYFETNKHKTCGKCDICKNKNIFKKTNKELIEFLNYNLLNNSEATNLFSLENFVADKFEKYSSIDYLYQLIFDNLLEYDRKKHTIILSKELPLNYQFTESIEINDSFPVVIKTKAKKRTATTKKVVSSTKKKVAPKKKRVLSPEHIAKMQAGRNK